MVRSFALPVGQLLAIQKKRISLKNPYIFNLKKGLCVVDINWSLENEANTIIYAELLYTKSM